MTTSTETLDSPTDGHGATAPRRGLLPRLGSVLAILPLGVWTVWHLWENLAAWQGPREWERAVTAPSAPILELTTSALVIVPLVLHTVWGIRRLRLMQPNIGRYRTYDNLKYILQRLSAIGVFFFLGAHIWLARLWPLIKTGHHETFRDISREMHHHMPTLVVYMLGVLGTAYHLANGVASVGMSWGFAASPRAMKRMNVISVALFLLLLAMGYGAIYALWDAGGVTHVEYDRGVIR